MPIVLNVPPPKTEEQFKLYQAVGAIVHKGEFMRHWRSQHKLDLILFGSKRWR